MRRRVRARRSGRHATAHPGPTFGPQTQATKEEAMRRLAVLAAVLTTALGGGLASVAAAGPPATDANGNFSVLDVDVFPPRAANPLGVTIGFHLFSGNRLTGQRQPASQSVTLRFPGFHENGVFFPKCPLPTTAQQVGSPRCSRASQVGRGTAEAHARPG